jgi:hypothetical protein
MRLGLLASVTALLLATPAAWSQTLVYRNFIALPDRSITGLSGIAYAGGRQHYAIADNSDRIYPLNIELSQAGDVAKVEIARPMLLPRRGDFEGIALSATRDTVFLSDESPGITQHVLLGLREIRKLPVPEIFKNIVGNSGFESLTISPDGKTLWTANERALIVDGNPQTPATPILSVTRVRLQRYDLAADGAAMPREQFEYETSGVHDWGGQIGLCDLAALPDGRLLALERSAAQNFSGVSSIRTRIFLIDTAGATDISKPPFDKGLTDQPQPPVKVSKTLLYDGFVNDANGENVEGLCLGPALADDHFAILGIVDNTDGGLNVSTTGIVSFELDLTPSSPASTAPTKSP